MAFEATRVIYDVSQAILELKKLDSATKKTGNNTKKNLEKGADGLKNLEKAADKLSPKLSKTAGAFTRLAAAVGPAGIALGAVGTAFGVMAVSLLNIPDLLIRSTDEFKKLTEEIYRNLDAQNRLSDIRGSVLGRSIRDRRDELDSRKSALTQKAIQIQAAQEVGKGRVDAAKDAFKRIEAELKKSVDRQKSIQDKLKEGQDQAKIDAITSGKTEGGAVVDLSAAAKNAAFKGDLDLAQKLTDEAAERAAELGNHVFYTNQIQSAQNTINSALQNQSKEEDKKQAAFKNQLKDLQKIIAQEEKRLAILKKQKSAIEREKSNIETIGADLNVAQRGTQDAAKADEAVRTTDAFVEAMKEIIAAPKGGFEVAGQLAALPKDLLLRGAEETTGQITGVGQLTDRLIAAIKEFAADPTVDTSDKLQETAIEVDKLLSSLRRASSGRSFGGAVQPEVDRLQEILKEVFKSAPKVGTLAADAGISPDKNIREQAKIIGEEVGARLEKALSRPTTPQAIKQGTPAPNQGAALPVPGGSGIATVNVNATVKGGIIDAETTRTITDLIRKEMRKLTTEANIA